MRRSNQGRLNFLHDLECLVTLDFTKTPISTIRPTDHQPLKATTKCCAAHGSDHNAKWPEEQIEMNEPIQDETNAYPNLKDETRPFPSLEVTG